MPTPTYVAIAKTVLTGTQATVTFSGISNAYTDLVLLISAQGSNTGGNFRNVTIQVNGTGGTSYSSTYLRGTGSAAASGRATSAANIGDVLWTEAGNTNVFTNMEIYIPNYAGSTNKVLSSSYVSERNNTEGYDYALASLFSNTAAITSITIGPMDFGSINTGSRFDLYGIKNS
jgi:hypothetical protein